MKKILSIFLVIAMSIQIVAFAEDNTEIDYEISISSPDYITYEGTELSTENLDLLSNVAKVKVNTNCKYITVDSSDGCSDIYTLAEGELKKVDDKIESTEDIYVHMKETGKATIFVTGYTEDMLIVAGAQKNIECRYADNRDRVTLDNIKVGGVEIDGYTPEQNLYIHECKSIHDDIEVTYKLNKESDSVEVITEKNKVHLLVFNRDKSLSNTYTVEFRYSFIADATIEINGEMHTQMEPTYTVYYGGDVINNIASVTIPAEYGYTDGNKLVFVKPGTFNIHVKAGDYSFYKEVTVSGDAVIDSPQHELTLEKHSKLDIGDICNVVYSSSVFDNDERISITSSNTEVCRVYGKKLVVVSSGTFKVEVEHPVHGRIFSREYSVKDVVDTVYEILPNIGGINITAGSTQRINYKLDSNYDRTLDIAVASGNSVKIYGNTILGVSVGKSKLLLKSGNAEIMLDVNSVSQGVVVPTDIIIENTTGKFEVESESIFSVQFLPSGSTVSDDDIVITSSKDCIIRKVGMYMYGITPKEDGEHTIKVEVDKFSISKNIREEAVKSETGGSDKPDVPSVEVPVEKIVLENTYISLEVGDTKTIKVKTISPASATNKEVRFESMNERYATVDKNGKVEGERKGTVQINVYSVSNPEIYATCTVYVYDGDEDEDDYDGKYRYPVDKVEIRREDNGKEVTIRNDKTEVMVSTEQQFIAKIYPYNATNQDVTWYSSNDNVAEVDEDGLLTAYRVGEIELRVVTRDGNHRDSIKVVITEWMMKPTSIEIVNIDNTAVNTDVKTGDKLALKVNFEPLLTTERDVIWTITEGWNLFTLSKTGDVEFKEVGKATIKVYTKDYSTYATLTFNITYSEDYWKDIGKTKNMSPRKAIEVTFSEPLSISNIQNGNIFVATTIDGNTKAENVLMELVDGNKTLRVSSLNGEWDSESTYYLLIKGASKSESGIQLIKNCRYTFETRKGRQASK